MTAIWDRDRWQRRLVDAGLAAHAEALLGLVEPSVRLRSEPIDPGIDAVGTSRLGGAPDVPTDFVWPTFRGVGHSFIAQLDLSDVRDLGGTEGLPRTGLLSFFFDGEQRVWGFDPADRDGWRVIFTPAGSTLRRSPIPADVPESGRFTACALRPRSEITFAQWESFDVAALGLSTEEQLAYSRLFETDERGPLHRLLGHPEIIQGDMQSECQLATNGIYCGDGKAHRDPRAAELRSGAGAWRLLLQIDSDDDAGMQWGDTGRIYYWLRRDAFAECRFESAWCVLQCS